ncbi:hypothetical protein [Mariniflexile sp. AS56]|uniref:hypothetical protein n=1 Tax=Mariniflexile sp. AS56 TaxID=3063957 RepID=UPI0026EAC0F9|nr:hypothetical protein [Mariniflexile sp. AS56]MDO7173128.1 hypothetical protein [Mariniflexile sp. AS56]
MLSKLNIVIILTFPFWIFFQSGSDVSNNYDIKIQHTFYVNHPGEKEPMEVVLIEIQNKDSLPIQYYMDVKSVICLEQVCKVIPVRIFWNNIGEYQNYKLKEGATLEKYEADLFESEDYVKLQSILSNKNSPFKEVKLDEVLTVVDETDFEDVDAVSGATALELNENDTVAGAALTCYTLWHWANGNMVALIKKNTTETVSNEQLLDFLNEKNKDYYLLALNELTKRKVYGEDFTNAVLNRVFKDANLLRASFKYIETAPKSIYFSVVKNIFERGGQEQKIAAIKSLHASPFEISKAYLDLFCVQIPNLKSFQEVMVFLELMQSRNANSTKVIDCTIPLLDANFLIARRTYWFLINENLDTLQQQKVEAFYIKNKDKL